MSQPILISLHPNEYIEGLCHYSFAVNLDKCMGGSKNFEGLFNKLCVPVKIKDSNLTVFDMITRINIDKY